ncbi:Hypothetical protein BCAN_A0134 [Brucella canis ATCC 23365]|uniref:Uncharacterized protein n=1 Tax=Brucella canis (strain ATCC 23365 / NCTC 10854 / RM-666) TaxID=483179 RepID=A9M776_BRUC2|nr:Hypothetical protein BCAN_A0134 [Brucella canis ATCC 23365]
MISTGTSPAFGPPISTVSMVSGFFASQATAARDFMVVRPSGYILRAYFR